MTENDVIKIIKGELALKELDLNSDNGADSLDQVKVLTAVEDGVGKVRGEEGFRFSETLEKELGTTLIPRKILDILKREGFVE